MKDPGQANAPEGRLHYPPSEGKFGFGEPYKSSLARYFGLKDTWVPRFPRPPGRFKLALPFDPCAEPTWGQGLVRRPWNSC